MKYHLPRILVAALRGGAGKTTVSIGLLAAWKESGRKIAAFKKGPDYIDASWLSRACGLPCYNLDTYLMGENAVCRSFFRRAAGMDGAIIEGNRGLFDGMDSVGSHSTASLAHLLCAPVILVIDCTKSTRTLAASVIGCQRMDPSLDIRAVILNRVGGRRHAEIVEECIREYCGIPVLGKIYRDIALRVPERHLGLVPPEEHTDTEEVLRICRECVEESVDLDSLWKIAENTQKIEAPDQDIRIEAGHRSHHIRVGVAADNSFYFYYPENIEALAEEGGQVVRVQPAKDETLPDIDALYIGGGFPEMHAEVLSRNHSFKASFRNAVEKGLPVYAECGGVMYLGEGIEFGGRFYPMTGIFPVVYSQHPRPQGHGYTLLEVTKENPYFATGVFLKGHEFHYSKVSPLEDDQVDFVCSVRRGYGFDGIREGLCYKNAFATFSHIHALGERHWAKAFMLKASLYQKTHTT